MKSMNWIVALLIVCWILTGPAQAAPPASQGDVSPAMLADLGLAGFQPMTDAQALQVRGKSFHVQTFGSVRIGAVTTPGTTITTPHSSLTFTFAASGGVFAGGFAFASAH